MKSVKELQNSHPAATADKRREVNWEGMVTNWFDVTKVATLNK